MLVFKIEIGDLQTPTPVPSPNWGRDAGVGAKGGAKVRKFCQNLNSELIDSFFFKRSITWASKSAVVTT